MIVDFRKHSSPQLPLTLSNCPVSTVETFKFLGITVSQDMKWEVNTISILKRAHQRMYFLRLLRKHGLPQFQFYTAVIESILCSSITVWFGAATKKDKTRLQRTVRTAEKIIGTTLPTLEDLHTARIQTRAEKILLDHPHPAHHLFQLLPSGSRYRSIRTKSSRHLNSFFPLAINSLNSHVVNLLVLQILLLVTLKWFNDFLHQLYKHHIVFYH
ncbi:uncharacterized protein LOC127607160 isoform X1 [Hippocampus zosterae]|uniref:uncharacterized protein LOC127607160 isoform X1 n=1 Tax=Hippocampus zosterae TaxID=109293 RepID=UPI00223DF25F|nr:uncharacterized protein LOC127607160 isoform X1 [Hippocampus zosterae]